MAERHTIALITGAAVRVGRAIALELAQAGADVAVHCNRSVDEAEATAREIESLGRRACVVQGDLADPDAPERIVAETVDRLGALSVLVNNASIWEKTPIGELSRAPWDEHLTTNLTAPAMLSRAAWRHLREARPGFIINICDFSGERPWADYIAYCVSKGGLITLTRALARAMAPDVLVNGLSPGFVMLPEDADEKTRQAALKRIPLNRIGDASDIAKAARFLIEDGRYITGQILNVDGGRTLT